MTIATDRPSQSISISYGRRRLGGIFTPPEADHGIVLFAHGSGSGRLSPRNRFVAEVLGAAGLGTLLFDLLDEGEADDQRKIFDVALLADRLLLAADWLAREPAHAFAPLGCFGASTGAAAALIAAARRPGQIRAVVSRGGRPDLAADHLALVRAPVLLIVGGDDEPVLTMNRQALSILRCRKRLEVVPGATHLFSEPGTLEQVAELSRDWFAEHLARTRRTD